MLYVNLMRILYMKYIVNETDPVSWRPDFLPVDNLRGPNEGLRWDENMPDIDNNGNDPGNLHYRQ
jgi:hypothetical protein